MRGIWILLKFCFKFTFLAKAQHERKGLDAPSNSFLVCRTWYLSGSLGESFIFTSLVSTLGYVLWKCRCWCGAREFTKILWGRDLKVLYLTNYKQFFPRQWCALLRKPFCDLACVMALVFWLDMSHEFPVCNGSQIFNFSSDFFQRLASDNREITLIPVLRISHLVLGHYFWRTTRHVNSFCSTEFLILFDPCVLF